jgi:type IV secretory pathway ATPase VirB11/archaellum biosynthesis ATPase
VAPIPWSKILYFAERDLVGFGVLDALLRDPNIEDISVDGLKKPLFVYHRKFESLGTNVVFSTDAELDNLISRLAHMAGKHISTAFPILQGILPGRHRLLATFRREVSPYGSTLCMKSGHVQLTSGLALDIKDLFEQSRAKWGSRLEQGNEIVDINGRMSVMGVNERTLAFTEAGIKQILMLPPPESLIRVWIKEGERHSVPFDVTANHKFHTVTPEGLRPVEAADLKPKSWIPVPVKIPSSGIKLKAEDFREAVFSSLRGSEHKLLVSLEGKALALALRAAGNLGGVHKAEKVLRVRWGYLADALMWARHKNGKSSMRLATFLELLAAGGVKPSVDELVLTRRNRMTRIPLTLTENLAFIAGWILSDGSLGSGMVKVIPASPENRDEIAEAFRKEFGLDYHLYGKHARYFDMIYTSASAADFLHTVFEIPRGPKARIIRVPRLIMESDNRVASAFLKGVFQGDGPYSRPGIVSLKSFSEMFLRDVQFLLTRFGVYSYVTSDNRLGVPVSYQDVFFDEIMGIEAQVGLTAGRVGKITPLPIAESLRAEVKGFPSLEILRCNTGVDLRSAGSRRPFKQNITFDRARTFARTIGIDTDKHWLFELIQRGYDFKVITKVESVPNSAPVYDVVCEPDHYYVGGVVPSIVYDTIRKFREDPLTVVDLLDSKVLDKRMAAYMWLMMENKATALMAGSTGSGKTTLLNALLTLTRANTKIVTIEEVQEVNIPHSNWTALVSRESYGASGETASQVGLFDLVKAAMRMRPDIIVVGEVRGEEAYVLFQAISTGHSGLCTLHADDVESGIQRLTSKPMDVPHSFIPFLNLVLTVRRIAMPLPGGGFRAIRRIVSVDEVSAVNQYFNIFKWNPTSDTQRVAQLRDSPQLARLARDLGQSLADVIEELNRRSMVIGWLQETGVRNFRQLSSALEEYLAHPKEVAAKASKELGVRELLQATPMEGFRL